MVTSIENCLPRDFNDGLADKENLFSNLKRNDNGAQKKLLESKKTSHIDERSIIECDDSTQDADQDNWLDLDEHSNTPNEEWNGTSAADSQNETEAGKTEEKLEQKIDSDDINIGEQNTPLTASTDIPNVANDTNEKFPFEEFETNFTFDPSTVVRSRTFDNGTVVSLLIDGTWYQKTKSGVVLVVFADGRKFQRDNEVVIQILPDGTKIQRDTAKRTILRLFPDGSRIENRADGSQLEVGVNGVVTETRADGVIVRMLADGTKEQMNPEQPDVVFRMGLKRLSTSSVVDHNKVEIEQTLMKMSDSSIVQINKSGHWKMIVKDTEEGFTIQKGFKDDTYIFFTKDKRTLIFKTDEGNIEQRSYRTDSDIPLNKPQPVDLDLLQYIKKRCVSAAKCVNLSSMERKELQQQNLLIQQQLARAERMTVLQHKTFEAKLNEMKSNCLALTKEKTALRDRVSALEGMNKKPKQKKSAESRHIFEDCTNCEAIATTTTVPVLNKEIQYTEVSSIDDGFQYLLRGIDSNLENDNDNFDNLSNNDPEITKQVIVGLNNRVRVLENQKKEVENNLNELSSVIQKSQSKKKKKHWPKFLSLIRSKSEMKSEKFNDTDLMPNDALHAQLSDAKQYRDNTTFELSAKNMESIALKKETLELRKQLCSVQKERDDLLQKLKSVEVMIGNKGQTEEDGRRSSSGGSDDSGCSMSMIPSLEQEVNLNFCLSTVSPML